MPTRTTGLEGRMKDDPVFREAELKVRGCERELNLVSPRFSELQLQVAGLEKNERQGREVTVALGRARADLAALRDSLADVRVRLQDATRERDALVK